MQQNGVRVIISLFFVSVQRREHVAVLHVVSIDKGVSARELLRTPDIQDETAVCIVASIKLMLR